MMSMAAAAGGLMARDGGISERGESGGSLSLVEFRRVTGSPEGPAGAQPSPEMWLLLSPSGSTRPPTPPPV